MSGLLWIVVGLVAGAFSLFAVPYGFEKKQREREDMVAKLDAGSFSLIESVYDVRLQGATVKNVPNPEVGNLHAILEVYEENNLDNAFARLQLGGVWNGSSGIIPYLKQDLVLYIKSEGTIRTLQKKPYVEIISPGLNKLYKGKTYVFRLMATPTIALPLEPSFLIIRTREGNTHTISNFYQDSPPGWYEAKFSF